MKIEEFIKRERKRLDKFTECYLEGVQQDPVNFPSDLPGEDWWEQYCSFVEVNEVEIEPDHELVGTTLICPSSGLPFTVIDVNQLGIASLSHNRIETVAQLLEWKREEENLG